MNLNSNSIGLHLQSSESKYLFFSYKKIFGVTAILFLNSLTSLSTTGIAMASVDFNDQEAVMELFGQNTRRFSLNLFSAINDVKPNDNLIFSPFSIQTCLAMAFAGANGKTADEMLKGLLLISPNHTIMGKSFKNVLDIYQNNDALKIANKFYLKTGYQVTPLFNEIATRDFYSSAENIEFSKNKEAAATMNKWVEDKTNGKIKNLISADALDDDTRLVLLNAIYFKAAWINQFKKELTVKEDFWLNDKDKVQVDMMNTKAKFLYGEFEELDAKVIEMPYRNSFAMFIVLPNSKTGLKELEEKLKTVDLLDLKADMQRYEVLVKLPKFKINFEIKLKPILQKMGMSTMFGKEADFSNLLTSPQPLEVSEVLHQAFIEVNEEGSEAAAATAAIIRMKRSCVLPVREPKEFIADHQLAYAIIDNEKNILLFSGSLRLLKEIDYHDEL